MACRHRIVSSSSCAPISPSQLDFWEDDIGTNHAVSTRNVLPSVWSRISAVCLRAEQFVGREQQLSHFPNVAPSTIGCRTHRTVAAPPERPRPLCSSRRRAFPLVDSRNSNVHRPYSDVRRPLHHSSTQVELLPRG